VLGGVFICYRREDSGGYAGRIFDRLASRLERKNVFIDVDNIEPGQDFVDVLSERVGKCDALVAVIGRSWISAADTDNRRRLDDPEDFVRIEIEAALKRGVRVIPVLIDGAAMPRSADLPDSLKKLVRRQYVEVSHTRFDSDVERLTRTLSSILRELRQRDAVQAELVAREEQETRDTAQKTSKAVRVRRSSEAEAWRRDLERRARIAARAERAMQEGWDKQAAAENAKTESARKSAEAKAAGLFKIAAGHGNADGQVNLGVFYRDGHGGLRKDDRKAARLFQLSADQGNEWGQVNLGFFYERGRGGLPKNQRDAARLYKLAADQGNPWGQVYLGEYYANGRGGLPRDYPEAVRLFKLSADQGNTSAQANLAVLYESGRGGLPKNEREAARLYRLAADGGSAWGQVSLGVFYEQGRGGLPKDEREAARLFKLSADQGNAWGRAYLGDFYENGRGGLTKDVRKAARLYRLAADQGNEYAQAALKRLGLK
jgi:TPR repeat protein